MELKEIVILGLLVFSILLFMLNMINLGYASNDCPKCKKCPEPNYLDLEFSEANFPSKVHNNIFEGPNVYQGGYRLDTNVSTTVKNQKYQNKF